MITFRESDHTYWDGNRKVPGVTSVMKPICSFDGIREEVLARKSELGKAVHLACEFLDQDDLEWQTLPDQVRPYVDAYAKFLDENKPRMLLIEHLVYHPVYRYAGQLDRVLELGDKVGTLDIKTSAVMSAATGVQTAAYTEAIKTDLPLLSKILGGELQKPMSRFGLQLKPDGTYRLHEYTSADDWRTFLALLSVRAWMEKNGKPTEEKTR